MLTLNPPRTLGTFKSEIDHLFERFLNIERPDFGLMGEGAEVLSLRARPRAVREKRPAPERGPQGQGAGDLQARPADDHPDPRPR